jgi:S-DNA-T family DNA segregation ATPase FtsK/SpoIIIE
VQGQPADELAEDQIEQAKRHDRDRAGPWGNADHRSSRPQADLWNPTGIRATELRPGKDVGTSIVTGATPERFEIVKWFYIEADDDTGYDAATDVIARAMGYLDQRTPIAEISAGPKPARRDLLNDLIAVLGEQRVPAADVPALLRDLAPDHAPYHGLTGIKLREILEREYGIRVASTGNRYPVDPNKIRACIARRAHDDPEDRSG